ncbi:MAG: FG-GAP repeat protein, partial [Myxococcales bacterium]|nr:FG-GAP repeat protein [Myxococcales bacterium]
MKKQLLMTAVLAGGLFLSNHALGDPTAASGTAGAPATGVFGEWSSGGTVDSTTGGFRHSIPIELPTGRGGLTPSLALTYDSAAADREAGYGWGLDLPVIERRPMSGFPTFDDATDRFAYSGAPLVYLCTVPACPDAGEPFPTWAQGWRYYRLQHEGAFLRFFRDPDGIIWRVQTKTGVRMEFGSLVAGGYLAAELDTLNPSQKPSRWLLAEITDEKTDAAHPNRVLFGWSSLGAAPPLRDPRRYLEHIWDTPSLSAPNDPSQYEHHTQLTWEPDPHRRTRYAEADRARSTMRLTRIGVASKTWLGSSSREVQRLYRLSYMEPRSSWVGSATQGPLFGHSFLRAVTQEGRCPGVVETAGGAIPTGASCAQALPPITLEYEPLATGNYLGMERELHPRAYSNRYESLHVVDFDGDGLADILTGWPETSLGSPLTTVTQAGGDPTFRLSRTTTAVTSPFATKECVNVGWADNPGTPAALNNLRPPGLLASSYGVTASTHVGDGIGLWRLPNDNGQNASAAVLQPLRSPVPAFGVAPNLHSPERWPEGAMPYCPEGVAGEPGWSLMARPGEHFWATLSTGLGSWFVDVDGDGIVDQINDSGPPFPQTGYLNPAVVAYSRKVGGPTGPRLELFQSGNTPGSSVPASGGPPGTHSFYADANGDGLVDLVVLQPTLTADFRVYAGNGRGAFGCVGAAEPGAVCYNDVIPAGSEHYAPPLTGLTMDWHPSGASALFASGNDTLIHDVTGDGLADLVQVERTNGTGNVRLWVNTDGLHLQCADLANGCVVAHLVTPGGGGAPGGYATVAKGVTTFGDVDGNGVDDIIVIGHKDNQMIAAWPISVVRPASPFVLGASSARAPRAGLLTKIHNGRGAVTQVSYGTIQELDLAERAGPRIWSPDPGETLEHAAANLGWATHSPTVVAVVSDVSTSIEPTYAPSATFQLQRATHYRYRNPAYDVWERRFLGFRRVRVRHDGTPAVTESWYSYSGCASSEPGVAGAVGSAPMERCAATSDDEPRGGRLTQVDHFIPGGGFQEPTSWLWSRHFNYDRPQGDPLFSEATPNHHRRVRFDYAQETFTRYFDPGQPVALQLDGGSPPFTGVGGTNVDWDLAPRLPAQGGAQTTLATKRYDHHGNLITTRAVGRIAG